MPEKGKTGVAKSLDIESISKDVAVLVKQLDKKVEGPIDVHVLKGMQSKIQKILNPPAER
jgi:hypothetical protein